MRHERMRENRIKEEKRGINEGKREPNERETDKKREKEKRTRIK